MATTPLIDSLGKDYTLKKDQLSALSDIHAFQKSEIHVHLEGATPPEMFWELAQKNKVNLPVRHQEAWLDYFNFKSFDHFIHVYTTATHCLQKPEDYTQLLIAFCEEQSMANITYSEAFISCSLGIDKFPINDWLDALDEGLSVGQKRSGVTVKLIADISRELPDKQDRVLEFALAGKKRDTFIGLGLGGLENGFPPSLFRDNFTEARKAGLKVTAHAGEAAGPDSIWEALELLGAKRIGHGIRCFDDPMLVEHLVKAQVPIEVNPVSNYRTGVLGPKDIHPIHRMVEAGLRVTLNTDDPKMFNTHILEECALLMSQGMATETVLGLIQQTKNAHLLTL